MAVAWVCVVSVLAGVGAVRPYIQEVEVAAREAGEECVKVELADEASVRRSEVATHLAEASISATSADAAAARVGAELASEAVAAHAKGLLRRYAKLDATPEQVQTAFQRSPGLQQEVATHLAEMAGARGVRSALIDRARASLSRDAATRMDQAVFRKHTEDGGDTTPCKCFLEKAKVELEEVTLSIKLADLDEVDGFKAASQKRRLRLSYYQLKAMGANVEGVDEHQVYVACQKSNGKIQCIDGDQTLARVKALKDAFGKMDVVEPSEAGPFESEEDCYDGCREACKTKFEDFKQQDWEGMCVDEASEFVDD